MALDTIPKQEGGKLKAVASGTLPSGQPVVVNADGTVSVMAGSDQVIGTPATFESNAIGEPAATFDSNSNKVVVAYSDSSDFGRGFAAVGTVSGTSISFGTPVRFDTSETSDFAITFDSNSNKVVIAYKDEGNSRKGTAIVGTVSGTSISFGSQVVFSSAFGQQISAAFDSVNNKVVIAYSDSDYTYQARARVGTVSGTSISFGSNVAVSSGSYGADVKSVFDSGSGKVVVSYNDGANSSYLTARVGTVSGTSISFGTATVVVSAEANVGGGPLAYDSNSNKVVIAYNDSGNSNYGTARVGTVSGTGISFGSASVFESQATFYPASAFDSSSNTILVSYSLGGAGVKDGFFVAGSVSGTSISFGSPQVFQTNASNGGLVSSPTFDSNSNKVVITYDDSNSNLGKGVVFSPASTNLTSENYIGISTGGAVADGGNANVGIVGAAPTVDTSVTTVGYDLSVASFDDVTASISQVGDERGLAFSTDGTKFYVLEGNSPQSVFQYNLSTAWDLSTSSYSNNSFSISSQETQPTGVTFKTDGTKMYVTGYTGDDVNEYSLSTAWDVSTASFVTNFSVSSQTTFTGDLFFKPDGLNFYICGASDLYQYTLSTAWDISTASYASKTVAILERDGLHFKDNGTEFFASGSGTDAVYKYTMSTAWDISTASYSSVSFSLASQDIIPKGLVFKDDGMKMFVTGVVGTDVNQYTTGSSFGGPLTAGQQYYVQTDGTLSETPANPSVLAGTAISATKLIVKT